MIRLCEEYGVARLEIFGSAVTGDFEPDRSDIDLVIDCAAAFEYGRFFELVGRLEMLLGREVQLVSRKSLRNPYFIHAIETTAVTIYPADEFSRVQPSEYLPRTCDVPFPARSAKLLWDIKDACSLVLQQTAETTFEDFTEKSMSSAATERRITLAGYALERLRERDPETASRLPGINDVIAARQNVLYEYDQIDYRKLWETVRMVMPVLIDAANTLLAEYGPPGGRERDEQLARLT